MVGLQRRALMVGFPATSMAAGQYALGQSNDTLKLRAEVIAAIHRKAPDLVVKEGNSDALINVNDRFVINIENLQADLRQQPEKARAQAIEEFVFRIQQGVKQSSAEKTLDWAAAKPLLRPRLVRAEYLQAGADLIHGPFAAGLLVAFVIDLPDRAAFIDRPRIEAWGVDQRQVRDVAYANLEEWTARLPLDVRRPERGAGRYAGMETRDSYDAARLVLPGFRARLLSELGELVYVGIPNRDFLIAWSADVEAMPAFVRTVQKDFREKPYALTDAIFAVKRDGLFVAKISEPAR